MAMDQAEEPPRCRGGAWRVSLPEGQRFVITGLSLVIDPASAVALPPLVHVWAEGARHGARVIGKLSPENPIVSVRPAVELGNGEFVLRHDSVSSTVRLYGYYLDTPKPESEGEPMTRTQFVEDIDAEDVPDEEKDICSEEVPDVYAEEVPGEEEVSDEEEDMYVEEVSDDEEEDMYAEEVPEEEEEEDMYAEEVPDEEEDMYADEEDDGMYAEEVPDEEDDGMYAEEVLEEEEEEEVWMEYEPLTEEDMAERYDSDNGEDDDEEEDRHPRKVGDAGEAAGESSKRNSIGLDNAPAGVVVPDGWPAQFAIVKNTAGFMRIAAGGTGSQDGNKKILVLYRYTRFSRTWSGRRGVEACRRTKQHWLRFAVPPAGDMGSSLAWAGSSLGPLIYPGLFRRELGDLWSSLAAPAINANAIPPQATSLLVVVDAGILRREDYTAERMEHMRGALEATAGEAWPEYHVGMELHLPEPVRREEGGDEDGDGARPAKRRRVVAEGEECSLCLDPLESGLAAWPGCGHVFHGQCVEQTLAGRATCPLCRHDLFSDALVC